MPRFRCEPLAELTRQLSYAPASRQRQQMSNAELLYWDIDPDRNYPLDYVVYRITGYPADTSGDEPVTLVGRAVREDLLTLVDQLSDVLEDPADRYDPPPMDLDSITELLDVTAKTISRYRRQGLFARRLMFDDRKKLGFLPDSVQRFVDHRGEKTDKAGDFQRMSESEKHTIVMRARRIAGRADVSPFRVAQHLGPKFGRSVETIRRLLIEHDQRDPRFAIFRDHTPPLSDEQQRQILARYRAGEKVSTLAGQFGKTRDAIYRAIHLERARELNDRRIHYIASRTFDLPEAEQMLLAPPHTEHDDQQAAAFDLEDDEQVLEMLHHLAVAPAIDRETEQALFAAYNYLKYRAATLRDQLDRHHPAARQLDQIETWLRQAGVVRRRIAAAFRPRVIGVARQHRAGRPGSDVSLIELVREGDYVLVNAIENFDYTGRGRFATYLNWALMRQFARLEDEPADAAPPADADPQIDFADLTADLAMIEQPQASRAQLLDLLAELDEQQRFIVTRHFGLAGGDDEDGPPTPQTLQHVADQLELPLAVVKRAQRNAVAKLRQAAAEKQINLRELRVG